MKGYINQDKNLNTIAALLLALAKSLKENYFKEDQVADLFTYVIALMNPLKAKYNVPLAALSLL